MALSFFLLHLCSLLQRFWHSMGSPSRIWKPWLEWWRAVMKNFWLLSWSINRFYLSRFFFGLFVCFFPRGGGGLWGVFGGGLFSILQRFCACFVQIAILRTKAAKEATLDILKTYCIPSTMSEDLKRWSRFYVLRWKFLSLVCHVPQVSAQRTSTVRSDKDHAITISTPWATPGYKKLLKWQNYPQFAKHLSLFFLSLPSPSDHGCFLSPLPPSHGCLQQSPIALSCCLASCAPTDAVDALMVDAGEERRGNGSNKMATTGYCWRQPWEGRGGKKRGGGESLVEGRERKKREGCFVILQFKRG